MEALFRQVGIYSSQGQLYEPEDAGELAAPSICYEDAFGEEMIDALPEATLLVNVSNKGLTGKDMDNDGVVATEAHRGRREVALQHGARGQIGRIDAALTFDVDSQREACGTRREENRYQFEEPSHRTAPVLRTA